MAASTEDIHELRQNVAALSKDLSVIKSMLFTLSNNLHPRPGSGASMRSLAFGAAPPNRRPMHMAHRERPAGSNVLDSVDTFPHDSSDDERHALESVHTPTPASTSLVPPHHEPEETAPNPLLITSVTTSKASPLSKPSHVLPATRRLSIDTATTMRKHSSRVLARNDESSSPSADTTVEAGHEAAPQTAFSATLKGPATSGGPAENNVRRVGFRGEDFIIVTVDVLFILSVTVSWLGAIFYTINGINGPESELVDTFIGLLVLSQIYSWIWIASRFFVQERRGDWEVLESLADIRQEYLSFWFKFDALLALPIDCIFLGWQPQIFFYCQLRHILKVVRYLTITTGSNPLVERRGILTLLAPLMGMVCIIHTAASVVCALNQYDYIPALYWAAVTMSSVGYGDKNATDTTHRVFGIIVIVLGVALVTAVTAVATSMLTAQDAVKLSVDAKKNLLNSMMNHYHVPWAVQLEVIGAFPTALENGNQEQFKALIENLPPFIVEKLTMYIRAKVVSDAIPSFQKCPVDVLLAVASRLLHRFIQANEAIVNVGEEGTEMYFLVRGVADVVIQLPDGGSVVVATLRSGTFFGEIALVTENCRRTASVYAEVLCELLVLNKVDFEELAAQYQEVKEFFGKVIEEAASRAKASGNAKNTSTTPVTASS